MKLIDKVKVQHSVCYDFLTSLIRLNHNKYFSPKDKPNKEIYNLMEDLQQKVPGDINNKLEQFFDKDTAYGMTTVGFIKKNEFKEIPEFIDYLKQVSPKEIIWRFLYIGIGPNGYISLEDVEQLLGDNNRSIQFINENLSLSGEQKWLILQFLTDPTTTKDNLIELLEWHYHNFYNEYQNYIAKFIKKYEIELKDRLKKYGQEYLNILIPYDYSDPGEIEELTIAVSYFYEKSNLLNLMEDIFVFGYRFPETVESEHALLSSIQVFKALSDETRLNIIRLLAERPWYGHELAQKLNVSNSTISHHVAQLVSNGLIRSYRQDNRLYFALDIEKMKKTITKSVDDILE